MTLAVASDLPVSHKEPHVSHATIGDTFGRRASPITQTNTNDRGKEWVTDRQKWLNATAGDCYFFHSYHSPLLYIRHTRELTNIKVNREWDNIVMQRCASRKENEHWMVETKYNKIMTYESVTKRDELYMNAREIEEKRSISAWRSTRLLAQFLLDSWLKMEPHHSCRWSCSEIVSFPFVHLTISSLHMNHLS